MPDVINTVWDLVVEHPLISLGAILAVVLYARLMSAGPGAS
jgi:hypothetical protein